MNLDKMLIAVSLIFTTLYFSGCEDNVHSQELYFIGDSHIARWDLGYYFPNYITYNKGVSGSNIQYLEECENKYANKNIVVMIGSNDIGVIGTKYTLEDYAMKYVSAIEQLHGKIVYIYSILPNDNIENNWDVDYSKTVPMLNSAIESELKRLGTNAVYVNIYNLMTINGYLNPEYYSDGLHLNYYGYEILANKLQEQL